MFRNKKGCSLKVKRAAQSEDKSSSEHPVDCPFTRGRERDHWHVWNTSARVLTLRKGDVFTACFVASDFEGSRERVLTKALAEFTVESSSGTICVTGRDIRFAEPVGDPESVAAQADIDDVCTSKGIDCASFLEHYARDCPDEELELGRRVCSLFVRAAGEMLTRKYDIMHHYPLFNRALELHYSEKVSSEPPEPKDLLSKGGLLDRSAEEHARVHGVPLVGLDHLSFSHWNYTVGEERNPGAKQAASAAAAAPPSRDSPGQRDESDCEPRAAETNFPGSDTDAPGQRDEAGGESSAAESSYYPGRETDQDFAANVFERFNNLAGTLTDGPGAYPYASVVHTSNAVKFDDLVNYCLKRNCEPVAALPARHEWGCVNPVLLMEDPADPETGRVLRRYTVASRGYLSTVVPSRASMRSLCFNEVFLPERPVSRLNLDMDLKCCPRCKVTFATEAERSVKRQISEAVTTSLILVIVESLLNLAKVTMTEFESDPSFRKLSAAVGKIAAYFRVSRAKSKLSLRMLWYLPVELCSFRGIETYKPLLDEMERISAGYVLMSYPKDENSCGLCDLQRTLRGAKGRPASKYLRVDPRHARAAEARRSSIDKAPYSFRKSVRLPNCYKEDSAFEYVGTFNTRDIENPGFEDPLSLSVGLSSNPITTDVTSLGPRFRDVLDSARCRVPTGVLGTAQVPDQARIDGEAKMLSELWGVQVKVKRTRAGVVCVIACAKSTTFPCPIHNKIHSNCKLGSLVFPTHTVPHCFVP